MINNRQAGRRRGRGGQQQRSQGGNPGRGQDNGNRIDNRARGNAAQLLEKYKALARDAQMQGDRVNTEYYLQFADHYFRVLAETRSRFEENNQQAAQGRRPGGANTFDQDEQDYEDEGEPIQGEQFRNEQQPPRQQNGNNNGYAQNGGQNGNQRNGNGYEDERPRRANGNGNGNGNGERVERAERPERSERPERAERPERQDRYEGRRPRGDEPRQTEAPVAEVSEERVEPVAQAAAAPIVETPAVEAPAADAPAEQPRRRGRPRRVVAEAEPAPTFDAGLLPPSLTAGLAPAPVEAAAPAGDGDTAVEEKPRRRRGRPPANATTEA